MDSCIWEYQCSIMQVLGHLFVDALVFMSGADQEPPFVVPLKPKVTLLYGINF